MYIDARRKKLHVKDNPGQKIGIWTDTHSGLHGSLFHSQEQHLGRIKYKQGSKRKKKKKREQGLMNAQLIYA